MPNQSTLLGQNERADTLLNWLNAHQEKYQLDLSSLSSASSDASFRRYFRIQSNIGTIIIMDAPPLQEDNTSFIKIAQLLAKQGLRVPQIYEYDLSLGFLLLSDLGQYNYYGLIQQGLEDTHLQKLYRDAIKVLVTMQGCPASDLKKYDATNMREELNLFETWYVQQYCKSELTASEKKQLDQILDQLAIECDKTEKVIVHRDYHSPNLMINLDDLNNNPGIIDFQDAVYGPITYDIASLVMDARTTWDEAQQLDWAIRYWEKAKAANLPIEDDFAIFHKQYEIMSIQRNLRILGVFARLALRDNKTHYLDHIPRVNQYLRQVTQRYSEYFPLLKILNRLEGIEHKTGYTF